MKDPVLDIVIKSTGHEWGIMSLNELEAQWLTRVIFSRNAQALEQKGEDGVSFRYLSVKYWEIGRPFVKLTGKVKDSSPTEIDIAYECIESLAELLKELLRRFRRMVLSLRSNSKMDRAEVEGIIDTFNEEEDGGDEFETETIDKDRLSDKTIANDNNAGAQDKSL
jgi:hypothetical protein